MPTSTRWEVANLPKIISKSVHSAGPMWASAPTSKRAGRVRICRNSVQSLQHPAARPLRLGFAEPPPSCEGEAWTRANRYLYQLYSFSPCFSRKNRKKVSRSGGRETGKLYAYAFSLCEAVKRFRMAANWQRVAVPVGRSLPSVPLMRPWPTAHCMAGTA